MNEFFFISLERFMKAASAMVGEIIRPENIDRWVSVTGPGSFTGIRIGIAALSGITLALNKEHLGISSLDAAALISGLNRLTVAAKLRLNEYALKKYDFEYEKYGEPYIEVLTEFPSEYVVINSSNRATGVYAELSRAVCDKRSMGFLTEPVPMYTKRSEAEINFDKKSHN